MRERRPGLRTDGALGHADTALFLDEGFRVRFEVDTRPPLRDRVRDRYLKRSPAASRAAAVGRPAVPRSSPAVVMSKGSPASASSSRQSSSAIRAIRT